MGESQKTDTMPAGERQPEERQLELPAWVPAAIGLTLVALAAMAVYTGFRTRVRPQEKVGAVVPFTEAEALYPEDSGGPPGSPGPGGSRVRAGSDIPTPGPVAEGETPRLAITGDAAGVSGKVNLAVRRGLVFDVQPTDTTIFVNDVAVGSVRQFNSADEAYEFAEEGLFTVRLSSPGFAETEIVVSADRDAEAEIAEISMRLQPDR